MMKDFVHSFLVETYDNTVVSESALNLFLDSILNIEYWILSYQLKNQCIWYQAYLIQAMNKFYFSYFDQHI